MFRQLALLLLFAVVIFPRTIFCQNKDVQAYLKGQKTKFFTEGHPKAKGVNLSIEYPDHWTRSEGERPNVVQKFMSNLSDGYSKVCLIIIKDLPDEIKLFSSEEIAEMMFSTETIKEMVPTGAKLIKSDLTKYDAQPGAWMIFVMQGNRAGFKLENYTLQHMLYYSGKLILVQCSVAGVPDNRGTVRALFTDYLLMFQLIGNSIIIHNKWDEASDFENIDADTVSSERYGEYWLLALIVSAILTWGIGLTPPVLIRFVFVKRPISKGTAFGVVFLLWFFNLLIFNALGSTSKTHGALLLVGWASYAILRKGAKQHADVNNQEVPKTPASGQSTARDEFMDIESYVEIDDSLLDEKDKSRVYGGVLGLQGTVTKQDIINAYKTLIAKYHPDKVSHLGKEFQVYAEKKTKDINKAFCYLKRRYNL